jgi:hypothetical protein
VIKLMASLTPGTQLKGTKVIKTGSELDRLQVGHAFLYK